MRPTLLVLALAASLALPSAAFAGDKKDRLDPERRAKVFDKLETIRIAKMTDALGLDATEAQRFFPVLQPFRERRREAQGRRWDALRTLKDQIQEAEPDTRLLTEKLDQLAEANRDIAEIADEEYAALKPVLDPVTLAKYYRFELEFDRGVGELIRQIKAEVRAERAGKAGGGRLAPKSR